MLVHAAWKEFPITDRLREGVATALRSQKEIFSFREEPLLASLVSALGFQYEVGRGERDRLSPALSVDLGKCPGNPWQTEVIAIDGAIGIRMWIPGVTEFLPRHADFSQILHPASLDAEGRLSQVILSPVRIAENYRKRGLELVVVRDWALDSFFAGGASVNYLVTNEHELEKNFALMQIRLLSDRRLAFFGTHDLTDHLLGGSGRGFEARVDLYGRIGALFDDVFPPGGRAGNRSLVISYLMGVVLDDCAQPAWYASQRHEWVLERAMELLGESRTVETEQARLELPPAFAPLMSELRRVDGENAALEAVWQEFVASLFYLERETCA